MAGRLLVEGGKLLTIDEPALLDESALLARKLAADLGPRRYWPLAGGRVHERHGGAPARG